MIKTVQELVYVRPSAVSSTAEGSFVGLETSGGRTVQGPATHPHFFSGFLTHPRPAAAALLSVAEVASTRYHRPTLRASLDPVVTGNGDRLRFESFSGCGGVYARLDVLRDGLDGDDIGHGTTYVDVNPPLREALTRVRAENPVHLRVGSTELAVTTLAGRLVEKKVALPGRWLRGFAETQVIAAGLDLRAEVSAAEAARFLHSVSAPEQWVVPAGRTLRGTGRAVPGAVRLAGPERLAALRRVLRYGSVLRLYGPGGTGGGAGAWEVVLPGMRFTIMLSPHPARGFSGEGAVLDALTTPDAESDAELVAVLLDWEPRIDPVDLAHRAGLTAERVRAALTRLGAAGRVGYDTAEAAYFHRELPYRTGQVERHNPRLVDARALFAGGAVVVDGDTATVRSGDTLHQVRAAGGVMSCTCRWWAEHRGGRGPCKHALAMRLAVQTTVTTDPEDVR